MAKEKKPAPAAPNNALSVHAKEGDNVALATAAAILAPEFRHAVTAAQIHKPQFSSMTGAPGFGDYADAIAKVGALAAKGDLAFASELLAAQALSLDSIFTEMARRMALNMHEHLHATDIYARIAMKAQAQSRSALEALAKLHQPREQTVRHVHVNEGGQAVIADQVHNHAGVLGNDKSTKQSLTTDNAGAVAALPSPDPLGNGMPVPSREGPEAMPDARWHEPGRA